MTNEELPEAATILLLRDGGEGVEVLMLLRPDRQSFGGAWVFPGGRIEAEDGEGDALDVARAGGCRETFEEVGLTVVADDLVPIGLWTPPVGIPKRIRTWFFAAHAPSGAVQVAADEVVAAQWFRPNDMLRMHAAGDAMLWPPTYVNLLQLTPGATAGEVLDRLRQRGLEYRSTSIVDHANGKYFVWGNDDGSDGVLPQHRNRLLVADAGWMYEAGDDSVLTRPNPKLGE